MTRPVLSKGNPIKSKTTREELEQKLNDPQLTDEERARIEEQLSSISPIESSKTESNINLPTEEPATESEEPATTPEESINLNNNDALNTEINFSADDDQEGGFSINGVNVGDGTIIAADTPVPTDYTPQISPEVEEKSFNDTLTNYKQSMEDIRNRQIPESESNIDEANYRLQMATGIAGALQSFGEGLAAITGGSAKPLQTGADTLRAVAKQGMDAAERKNLSVKDRILLAREPLATQMDELKFRDIFEKRQRDKRLQDPNSKESEEARILSNNFLDVYIANIKNQGADQEVIDKIENIRPKLDMMSAAQSEKFLELLKGQKISTSFEAKEESKFAADTRKQSIKLSSDADKAFATDSKKIAEELRNLQRIAPEMKKFQADVEAASRGDKDALSRVKINQGVMNYLIARDREPRGVFTDQDLAALSQFKAGKTWGEALNSFISAGVYGTIPRADLKRMSDVLTMIMPQFDNSERELISQYQRIYKASNNPFMQDYAGKFNSELFNTQQKPNVSPNGFKLTPTGG